MKYPPESSLQTLSGGGDGTSLLGRETEAQRVVMICPRSQLGTGLSRNMDLGLSHWQVHALSHPPVPMELQLAWVNGHCRLTASSPVCCFISPNNTAHSLRSVGFLCSHTRGRVPPSTLASWLRTEGLLRAGGGV